MEAIAKTYRWFVIYLLWMTHALQALSQSSLAVTGPLIKQEWNLSNVEFGAFFGIIAVGSVATHIPAGIACDKYGYQKYPKLRNISDRVGVIFIFLSELLDICICNAIFSRHRHRTNSSCSYQKCH